MAMLTGGGVGAVFAVWVQIGLKSLCAAEQGDAVS
jgi:hypothetical protein